MPTTGTGTEMPEGVKEVQAFVDTLSKLFSDLLDQRVLPLGVDYELFDRAGRELLNVNGAFQQLKDELEEED